MSAPNDPAYPRIDGIEQSDPGLQHVRTTNGMTIRQAFVMAAMQSVVANQSMLDSFIEDAFLPAIGNMACQLADACLAAERESRS